MKSPIRSLGYEYKDATGTNGPVKAAFIKRTPSGTFLLKVAVSGRLGSITVHGLNHAAQGDAFFRIGSTIDPNRSSQFKGKNAPALVCSPSGAFLDNAAGTLF